ncbi:PCI domain-containing protein [Zalerion maritima]|uniref:PCI domain-containing protein n=1 Tax=Zalerion maritima TaxID=339359 RepID=A0AAD5WQC1_9PEZI|nr:PCI domain-containing protein [Zalerion maritima]
MATTTQFLSEVRNAIHSQDGDRLAALLRAEPPVDRIYFTMGKELQSQFQRDSKVLETLISKSIPEEDDVPEERGTAWPSFTAFLAEYLAYWRDADFEDLIQTHTRLSGLVTSCASALSHPAYGSIMLMTSIYLSRSIATLTGTLHTRPDLVSILDSRLRSTDEEEKSVVEMTAEIITKIFTTCLNDRSSTRFAPPKGKKTAVYQLANLVLKLLFMSKKTRPAQQIFTQLATLSPPLKYYPASQRVTYLYYLGRFNFVNNHFVRAAAALESSYLQTPAKFTKHRTAILTYLVPSNLLVGRLPTRALLSRPEAAHLAPIFSPLGQAIKLGSFVLLSAALAEHSDFLFSHGLLLVLNTRLRPIIWRSLARRTFQLTWTKDSGPGLMETDGPRRAATLSVADLVTTAAYQQKILEGYVPLPSAQQALSKPHPKPAGINPVYLRAVSKAAMTGELKASSTLVPPAGGRPKKLRPLEGVLNGNMAVTTEHVEMLLAGLVQMGWLRGYMALAQGKFAVSGVKAKNGDAVAAGWPGVWEVVGEKVGVAKGGGNGGGGGFGGFGGAKGGKAKGTSIEVNVPGWIVGEP